MMKENSLGIYIHIPFCMSKCPYCDFYSIVLREKDIKEKFLKALVSEINAFSEIKHIDTIYFGGGTPNMLEKEDFEYILDAIYTKFGENIDRNVEITTEFNPKSEILDVKSLNINRFSLGVQSFNPKTLRTLGRIHTNSDTFRTFDSLRRAKISNISIDIMFGIPGETYEDFISDINEVIKLNPEHISLYSLEFMEGTLFTKKLNEGKLKETEAELDRKMYHEAIRRLKENGYNQYEISNFSKTGFESRHNLKYWNMDEYIGFGPSAHSYINGKRFKNASDITKYIENPLVHEVYEEVGLKDLVIEYTFTKLRTVNGINFKEFFERFNVEFFEFYKDIKEELIEFKEYINLTEDSLSLNEYGFDISNDILCLFV